MFEDGNLFFFANFVEIVHVELAYERRKLFVFEIFREDLVFKEILMLDDEAGAIVSPLDYMAVPFIFQYFVSLHDEVGNVLFLVDSLATGPFGLRLLLASFLQFNAVGLIFVRVSF